MVDEFIQGLITGAPNLAVAIWIIFLQHRTIRRLEAHVLRINAHLLSLPPANKEETD